MIPVCMPGALFLALFFLRSLPTPLTLDLGTHKFVKYVSAAAPGSRWDVVSHTTHYRRIKLSLLLVLLNAARRKQQHHTRRPSTKFTPTISMARMRAMKAMEMRTSEESIQYQRQPGDTQDFALATGLVTAVNQSRSGLEIKIHFSSFNGL